MSKLKYPGPSKAIGRALKTLRRERGLSLRAVAEASRSHADPVGFDYLSKLEDGQLMPSVPKLSTLAAVYGRPISELIDLYEIEQLRKLVPKGKSYKMLRELGIKALDRGEITKAMSYFLGALDAASAKGGDPSTLAMAHNNLGGAMLRAARYLTARGHLEEGLRIDESPHVRARLYDNLAGLHYQLDNLAIAEVFSREALTMAGSDEGLRSMARGTRAAILNDMGRYTEAEALIRGVIEDYRKMGREVEEIRFIFNLGYCLVEQGKMKEGLSHLRTAAARAVERGDADLRAKSQYFYGRALFRDGRKEDAGVPLRASLKLATDHDLRNEVFHSAYYLWLLAMESHAEEDVARYFDIATRYRKRLQQRSEETAAFDEAAVPARKTVRARATAHQRR